MVINLLYPNFQCISVYLQPCSLMFEAWYTTNAHTLGIFCNDGCLRYLPNECAGVVDFGCILGWTTCRECGLTKYILSLSQVGTHLHADCLQVQHQSNLNMALHLSSWLHHHATTCCCTEHHGSNETYLHSPTHKDTKSIL